MSTPLSLAARLTRMLALRDLLDTGGARLEFYTLDEADPLPTTPETTTTETLLGNMALAAPSGSVGYVGYVAKLTMTVPRTTTALDTALVGMVRFVDGAGDSHLDLRVGKVGEVYDPPRSVLLSDLQVYTGGELQLISCVISG